MIDRFLAWLHRRRHGHQPAWDAEFDGLGRAWYCVICRAIDRAGDFGLITED